MHQTQVIKIIIQTFVGLLLVFVLIGVIIKVNFKIDSHDIKLSFGHLDTEKIFVHFLESENHYFYQNNQGKNEFFTFANMSNTIFSLATNIKPTDTRTFLGSELPGLHLFDTEIIVAGEGTNLASLPYESSPPLEVLLKQREIADENIKQMEEQTDPSSTPTQDNKNKSVFIYQSHSWESFLPYIKNAQKINDAISEDSRVNVVGLGKRLSSNLERLGIGVEHNQTNMTQELHSRKWDTTKSYSLTGSIVEASASKNKELTYFIDIHRDSARKALTTKTINGLKYARLYFIVGKENKNYQQNLQFVTELNSMIEKKYPGISRGVVLKTKFEGDGVYNQDISNKAILMEVGGVDNTLEELNRTIDVFSAVFAEYYWNAQEAEAVNANEK